MKKTVILILAILPIFLVITISFAGRIISYYQHVPVERVTFVDENGSDVDEKFVFVVNVGEEKPASVKIYPENATNKRVSFASDDEEKFTVDADGKITGVSYGAATLVVTTADGSKTAKILVKVTADKVTGVSFPVEETEITVGDKKNLTATVTPYVAIDKRVDYFSSDESIVTIDANGNITAKKAGEATVTVRTKDGGFEDTCKVVCVSGTPALYFDFSDNDKFVKSGDGYIIKKDEISEFNLKDYLMVDAEKIDMSDVKFIIVSGSAKIDGDRVYDFNKGILKVVAYVGEDENSAPFKTEVLIMVQ